MRDWAKRAVGAAESRGERPLGRRSRRARARCAVAGRDREAEAARRGRRRRVDALPDEELAARVDAAAYLAAAETYLDRYDDAVAHAERALASAAPRAICSRR